MISYPEDCILQKALIFDIHAHYTDKKFDDIRDELLSELPKNGVCGVITCGCDYKSSKEAISLSKKYGYMYCAVGIHPENLDSDTTVNQIEKLSKYEKCVAIGEIGLDYYYNSENKQEQIKVFTEQILLAKDLNLPVIVHDRDAHADTLEILKKYKPKGVVHCFSGSPEMAKEIINIGMYIGVGGVVTFKNAKRLPEVTAIVPNNRLLIETDCPYLSPEPLRGKICHSGLIPLTAEKIAQIRNVSTEDILKLTAQNAKELFCV